jgi:tetratricopeptide (TPR) repeat protein
MAALLALAAAAMARSQCDMPFQGEPPLETAPGLSDDAVRTAEAHTAYLLAIFLEESRGPDAALPAKERVLRLDPSFVDLALDVARHHLRLGDTPRALSILKDSEKACGDDTAPAKALASIYLRHLGKTDLAEKFALKAYAIDPLDPAVLELLFDIHGASGNSRKTAALLDRAASAECDDPDYWLAVAELLLRRGAASERGPDMEKITAIARKAADLSGGNATTLAAIADFQKASGQPSEAADLYKKALAIDPSQPGLREKLATSLIRTGETAEALVLLEEIVRDNPVHLAAYDQLAAIHRDMGDHRMALANMRQALLLSPSDPRRYDEIIRIAFAAGETVSALEFATEAEERFPYLAGFTLLRAVALGETGDHAGSIRLFERLLVEASNANPALLDVPFYMSYASVAERAGHHTKAAELLLAAIELEPRNAEACNFLGYMWAELGTNLDEAEELVRRALEIEPDNGAYVDSLGWIHYQRGDYEAALPELLRAAELVEEPDPVILEHIGDTYRELGKPVEALLYWGKALSQDPDNVGLAAKVNASSTPLANDPKRP